MRPVEIKNICAERLSRWSVKLVTEHATPVILIGVGHDHKNGEIVVCGTEGMSDEDARDLLLGAARGIK